MNYRALESVRRIWECGGTERGKILQIMLAIAFDPQRGGFDVKNKFSEGVDVELVGNTSKYAVEVKCTESSHVLIAPKDIQGLRAKETDDRYISAVAALRIQFPFAWVVGRASKLSEGVLDIRRLERSALPQLELIANREFEKVVQELKERIFSPPSSQTPLGFLQSVLVQESQIASDVSV